MTTLQSTATKTTVSGLQRSSMNRVLFIHKMNNALATLGRALNTRDLSSSK